MNVYLRGVAAALARLGYEVELLTRAADAADTGRIEHVDGTTVRFLAAGPAAPVAKENLTDVVDEFRRALASCGPYNIVHSHYWLSGMAALPVARAQGAPHVLSLHTVAAVKNARLAPGDRPEPAERLDAERSLIRGSDAVVASTDAEREAIAAAGEVEASRVVVIPPGVDTTLFHPADADAGPTGPRYLLMVGRIQPLKAQDLAIAALALIPAATRPLLVFAGDTSGPNDRYREALDRAVDGAGLGAWVRFAGPLPRDELARTMRGAAALLVPSHSETYGLVTLEAAASGVPVVAARTAGLVDAVIDGRTGILVDSRDPSEWARAITSLLSDPDRIARLSASAAAYGAGMGWDRTAALTATLYDRLTTGRSRP
jgi:D-inositol-3-phosphate glycosyltransferase